jgi:hypothetical protein
MNVKAFLILIILGFALLTQAQTVHFTYDGSGNRTNRWVDTKDLKDPAADTTFKLGKEFWPSDTLWVKNCKYELIEANLQFTMVFKSVVSGGAKS